MNDTQFYDDFGKVVKNRAYSYEQENGVYIKKNLNYSHSENDQSAEGTEF